MKSILFFALLILSFMLSTSCINGIDTDGVALVDLEGYRRGKKELGQVYTRRSRTVERVGLVACVHPTITVHTGGDRQVIVDLSVHAQRRDEEGPCLALHGGRDEPECPRLL